MPAPEAKASSTLKWRVAILQQLAVIAGCCFWRGARGRPRGREGGCPHLAGVGCTHPLLTHRGCPSCPCTGCLCGRERRGLLLACKGSLGWCCCRMPYYMILGPRRSKKAQKAATGVLRSINPLARLQVLQCMVLLQRVRSSVCTGVPVSTCTKHMAWFWMCPVGFHVGFQCVQQVQGCVPALQALPALGRVPRCAAVLPEREAPGVAAGGGRQEPLLFTESEKSILDL